MRGRNDDYKNEHIRIGFNDDFGPRISVKVITFYAFAEFSTSGGKCDAASSAVIRSWTKVKCEITPINRNNNREGVRGGRQAQEISDKYHRKCEIS